MSEVSLAEQVGRLLFVGFDGLDAPQELLTRIARGQVGGVILFSRNIDSPGQVSELVQRLHAAAPAEHRLFVSVDQEGGRVQRLRAPLCEWPPMARLGAIDDLQLTEAVGRGLGEDLRLLGFDIDFAPVLDVVDNAENTVIGDRAFGATAEAVAAHGVAFARGLASSSVLACGKHFPGHGGPVADSHHVRPQDDRDASALERDLVPFRAAIAADLPLLMVAHVVYPALDASGPATFSRAICHDLLRDTLGFEGAVVSDDLEMGAIVGEGAIDEAAHAALRAGIDLFLVCHRLDRQEAVRTRFAKAVRDDEPGLRARVEQALARRAALAARLAPTAPLLQGEALSRALDPLRHAALLARLG